MKTLRALAAVAALLFATPASADFAFTSGSGNTAFDFTCFTTKHCFATVLINSAGTEIDALGFKADPAWVSGDGTLVAIAKTIANNSGGPIPTQAPTVDIGAVGISQTTVGTSNAVSLKYLNTTAIAANSGNKDGGTQRTVLATDQLALPTWGHGATGAAPPVNSIYLGANSSGATGGLLAGLIQCDSTAIYDASTNGSTELKALTSGRSIYVCGYTILSGGTVNVKLIYGTGTACATGSNNMTPAYQLTAQVGAVDGSPFARGLKTASANALCINTSAGVAVQAIVYYAVI